MKVIRTIEEMRRAAAPSTAFVPTMGALHEGHLSLLRAARGRAERVVMSIFVNPLQFGPTEDYASYPRAEEHDVELAAGEGVDVAFLPSVEGMYPPGGTTTVDPGAVAEPLEGAARPGHFRGVATVVAKLFNIVGPRVALFGQKDAQQVAVIKRMVSDLAFDIDIVTCPTVRDTDGLALSSRNRYLSEQDRRQAVVLWRALSAGRAALARGGTADDARRVMWNTLAEVPDVAAEYAEPVDPDTFGAVIPGKDVLLAVAARVGTTRLIDNVLVPVATIAGISDQEISDAARD